MAQDTHRIVNQLAHAARALDRPHVTALCDELIARLRQNDAPLAPDGAEHVLSTLRRKRFFPQMERVADALIQTGQDAPVVRRQYAQALIDQGALTAAVAVLRILERETAGHDSEHAEARGLLGRAFKQQYVSAGHPRAPRLRAALGEAIRWYHEAYAEQPARNHWHGINAVACLARARRDGVDVDADVDERRLADEILSRLRSRLRDAGDPLDAFELATALEACVALGDADTAWLFAHAYVGQGDADAFELASTVRQLTEVWALDQTGGIGGVVLPVLRAALLAREAGHVDVSAAEVASAAAAVERLERVFGPDGFQSLAWYRDGLARARLVAQLKTRQAYRGCGTGFLVPGEALAEPLRGRWLLLTNAHVVSDIDAHRACMRPSEAIVTFEATSRPGAAAKPYGVRSLLWVSAPNELDTAVLELDRPVRGVSDAYRCEAADRLPTDVERDRIYIIGHPAGGSLSYSLQDNLFLGHRAAKLHYRTPTQPGSSGSPLFDARWRLIGIHHAGGDTMPRLDGEGTYQANEGISIHAIREALAAEGVRPGT
jgi:hypothetical protein